MLKNMLQLGGVQKLNTKQLKNTNGGAAGGGIFCYRELNGVYVSTTANQSAQSAGAWVIAWEGLGWTANCFGIQER
ncbi:hypothetical protein [Dokdonia sp.]|uniref:hypothetical protein n=1 Tax=Dokdonia sp. TaxID=2024995 RepID=UPI003266EDEC